MIENNFIRKKIIILVALYLLLNGCHTLKLMAFSCTTTRLSDKGYEKIIGKRYEVVSPDIYLTPKEMEPGYHPYPTLISLYAHPMSEVVRKKYIHIPPGTIFKIHYVSRSECYYAGNFYTHYVAKFETPGIYDEEFRLGFLYYFGEFNKNIPFNAGLDDRFNERFIRMNPKFLKEIE